MKFRGETRVPRGLRGRDVLVEAEPVEEDLNQRMGLTEGLKQRMLRENLIHIHNIAAQGNESVSLITLFPERAEELRGKLDQKHLVEVAKNTDNSFDQNNQADAVRTLLRLFPDQVTWNQALIKFLRKRAKPKWENGPNFNTDFNTELKAFLLLRELLKPPHQAPSMQRGVSQWVAKEISSAASAEQYSVGNTPEWLTEMQLLLELDPTNHALLHTLAEKVENQVKANLQGILEREGHQWVIQKLIKAYATFKLLLAEQIEVGPTGIMRAIPRKRLSKGTPLPDRFLAV